MTLSLFQMNTGGRLQCIGVYKREMEFLSCKFDFDDKVTVVEQGEYQGMYDCTLRFKHCLLSFGAEELRN